MIRNRVGLSVRLCCFVVLALLAGTRSGADVTLPAIFGDHMVLQSAERVPVWGRGSPGERVTVRLGDNTAHAIADAAGRWRAHLDLRPAEGGPFRLLVQGNNRLVLEDVLVGEVWLASGQSNMEFPLRDSIDGPGAVADSSNPQLRFFKVARKPAIQPQENMDGQWMIAAPNTTASFSAVGYHFGRNLQQTLSVPVGVIDTSIGGTRAESWMSAESIDASSELSAGRERLTWELSSYPQRLAGYRRDYAEWEKAHRREDRPAEKPEAFAGRHIPLDDWTSVRLPARFATLGLPDSGVVWFRKSIHVTPGMAQSSLRIDLGDINEFVDVYRDGNKVGQTDYRGYPGLETRFTYHIPQTSLNQGDAVLAIRVRTPAGEGALRANPSGTNFRVIRDGVNRQFLAGEWLAKTEYVLTPLASSVLAAMPREPALPPVPKSMTSSLFYGLIHPILSFRIRGVIWYQGEGNTGRAWQYRTTFPLLIDGWRRKWNNPEWPFYFCQLANFGPIDAKPAESPWAELREAQTMTASMLPHTGMAVLIDVGEEADIHPRNKATVGDRLVRLALAKEYGKSVVSAAPAYQSMEISGDIVRLVFSPNDEPLVANPLPETYRPRTTESHSKPTPRHTANGTMQRFSLCGEDRKWFWADEARIEGSTVMVSSTKVSRPIAVRYAWSDNPVCNLYGSRGLPVRPFRTDDFPAVTRNAKY